MPYVVYEEEDGQTKSVRLKQDGKLSFGRGQGNEIRLASNLKVSRNHCVVYFHSGSKDFVLKDLGSTNGTLLNGLKISSDVILSDGDLIGVGGLKFRYIASEELPQLGQKDVKKAEPVMAFGLNDLNILDHTQSLRIASDADEPRLPFGIQQELDFHEGSLIGENVVVRKISDTQMACVFVVKSPQLEGETGQEAALKIFKKAGLGEKAEEEFLGSVQEAAKIQHPGFVKYLEAGVHEDHCYCVSEYLENMSLARVISRKAPLPEGECLERARLIGASLSYGLGSFRLFHRNLKPSNILFRKDDSPAIADYGMAVWESKYLAGRVSIASPWYISPEQVTGKRIGWSTDLYSLGVILFQMLTGVLPFHSTEEQELLALHLEAPFPKPVERNPNVRVSPETVALLAVMTEKDPAKRFPNWAEFLRAVDRANETLKSSSEQAPYRPERTGLLEAASSSLSPKASSVKRGKIVFRNKR